MGTPQKVPVKAVIPYGLLYVVTSKKADLTQISTARFVYRRGGGSGSEQVWTVTVQNATPRRAELLHGFVLGDLPAPDEIIYEPRFVIPSLGAGEFICEARRLVVFEHPSVMPAV